MRDGKRYTQRTVAEHYEECRFSGEGGVYVDSIEKAILRQMIQTQNGRALDLACGTGRLTEVLETNGLDVIGVDISKSMLQRARDKVGVPLIQADTLSLPFDNAVFNIVVAFRLLYFLDKPYLFLAEVRRVLNKDGIFIFSTDNQFSTRGILNILLKFFFTGRGIYLTTPSKLVKMLRRFDFEIIAVEQAFTLPLNSYRIFSSRLLHIIKHLDRIMSNSVRVAIFVSTRLKS